MPRFDRTGPEGQGSQTGQRLGKCNPNNSSTEGVDENLSLQNERGQGSGLRRRLRLRNGNGQRQGNGGGKPNA